MSYKKKNLLINIKNKIRSIHNIDPISDDSKKLKKKRLIKFNNFKKHILDPSKNPLLNKFKKKRYIIEANSSLQIQKNRFTLYKSPNSKQQFSTVYNQPEILYQNRLNEMLSYFTIDKDRKKIIKMIENKDKDDKIFKYLKHNYKFKKIKKDKSNLYKIAKLCDKILKYTNNDKNNKIKILDIGIGNGKKTKLIENLTNCEIYGADIKEWGHYNNKKNFNFPFKFISQKPYKIPYKNKMFDCITLILTLHHTTNILEVIKECKRLLKDDGIIAIIEHDVWNDYDNMIIDLQHKTYNVIFNEKEQTIGDYYNFYEWDMIFYKCGMIPIYADRLADNSAFSVFHFSENLETSNDGSSS